MTTDSFFALTCMATLALFYGATLAFAGYRFFLFLLPIWGFFFGFGLGAQTIQAIFNTGFLSDVTSWVVGFFVGLLFAVGSYLLYFAAVAILAGALGYTIGVGLMGLIGIDFGLLTWLVGMALGIILAVVTIMFNIQKWIIILATAVEGAAVITGTFLFLLGKLPAAQFVANPVKLGLQNSPFWLIIFLVVAVLGFLVQYQASRAWTLETYNRVDEYYPGTPAMAGAVTDTSASGPTTPRV